MGNIGILPYPKMDSLRWKWLKMTFNDLRGDFFYKLSFMESFHKKIEQEKYTWYFLHFLIFKVLLYFNLYLNNISIHRKLHQNIIINEWARKKIAKPSEFRTFFLIYRRTYAINYFITLFKLLKTRTNCSNRCFFRIQF